MMRRSDGCWQGEEKLSQETTRDCILKNIECLQAHKSPVARSGLSIQREKVQTVETKTGEKEESRVELRLQGERATEGRAVKNKF